MGVKTFILLLFCFSLMASYLTDDDLYDLRSTYLSYGSAFDDYADDNKVLELQFIRQDGTACGVRWNLSDLGHTEQNFWRVVGEGIILKIFSTDPVEETHMINGLKNLERYFFQKHATVTPNTTLVMPRDDEMREIAAASGPWALGFRTRALFHKPPGTLSLTAVGAQCCLLRVPGMAAVAA